MDMEGRKRARVALLVVLVVAAGVLLGLDWIRLSHHALTQRYGLAEVGKPAPDFALVRLDGSPTSLARYEGRPLWLNFWASWCGPCKAEFPDIERMYLRYAKSGLVVLGVDQEETAAKVKSFARERGATFPLVIDQGAGTLTYAVAALPMSVFIDAGGIVRFVYNGQMSPQDMQNALDTILPSRQM